VRNQILLLTERSRNQTPRGIGPLPEQTLRNPSHVDDDNSSASSPHEQSDMRDGPKLSPDIASLIKAALAYLAGTISSILRSYANRADAVSECSGM
jgi:hypothetical protein